MARQDQSAYWWRRAARNVIIAVVVLACAAASWKLFSERRDLISHLSIASAYPSLLLLAATLLLGPWNLLRRRPNPISFDLRRDLGIWAGITAVFHTVIGLNVHLRGRPWLYFIDEHRGLRHDLFGFSNDTGLFAALLFLLLLAISNDLSLRRLGSRRWKSLQQWTYLAALLTVMHAVGYQSIEKRPAAYCMVLWSITAAVCVTQGAGVWRRTHDHGSNRL